MLAEVDEGHAVVERIAHELLGGERHEDLPAVRGGHEPGGAIDRGSVVVAVAVLGFAGVYADADPQRLGVLPTLRDDRSLRGCCGRERLARAGEHCVHAIAGHLHDAPVVLRDRRTQQLVVTRQRDPHGLRLLLPESRRTFEIGEDERHGAGGRLVHAGRVRRRRTVMWRARRCDRASQRACAH